MTNDDTARNDVIIQAPQIEGLYKDACLIIDKAQQTAYCAVNEMLIYSNFANFREI